MAGRNLMCTIKLSFQIAHTYYCEEGNPTKLMVMWYM